VSETGSERFQQKSMKRQGRLVGSEFRKAMKPGKFYNFHSLLTTKQTREKRGEGVKEWSHKRSHGKGKGNERKGEEIEGSNPQRLTRRSWFGNEESTQKTIQKGYRSNRFKRQKPIPKARSWVRQNPEKIQRGKSPGRDQ